MLQTGAFSSGKLVVKHYEHTTDNDSDQKEKYTHRYKTTVSYYLESSISWNWKSFMKRQTHVQVLVQEYEKGTVTLSIGKKRLTHVVNKT